MASATATFSQLQGAIRRTHTGISVIGAAYTNATTVCPSTVLMMCQVPNGATLVDYSLRIQTGGNAQAFQMGTSQTPSGIMPITTLCHTMSTSLSGQLVVPLMYGWGNAGVLRPGASGGGGAIDLFPVRISLSDDVQPAQVWIRGNVAAGCSASAFFTLLLFYTCDGLGGHTTIR